MSVSSESLSWWPKGIDEAERSRRMVAAQKAICNLGSETYRRDKDLENIRLYESSPLVSLYDFAGKFYAETVAIALLPEEDSINNRAKSAIDTLASQIASTDQRARFMSVDGDYRQKRRARSMQDFADGLAYDLKLHRLRQRAFLDAGVLESGVGCIQFYRKDGRCAAQRVLATELTVDPRDGLVDGEPRTLYRRRPMARDKVKHDFGGDEKTDKAIDDAPLVATAGTPGDYIEVFEAWTLPTGEGAGDGWHIIGLDVKADDSWLLVEPYTKPYHEIVFFSIEGRFTTGWGLSLMTQARKLQKRINANTYRIDRAQKLFHAGHLYVPREMKFEPSKATNQIGSLWYGNGPSPPQQIMFQCAAKEMYDSVERDGQRIFENLGINLHASQAQTNTSTDSSGAAKREEKATSDERSAVRQQRWEQFHIDCMRVALGIVRDIVTGQAHPGKGRRADKRSSYKVAAPGKRGLSVVDWRDVSMDEKDYVLQVKPASPVPTDPAGLMDYGQQMVDIGAWTPQKLAGFMQDLDAESRTNRMQSAERLLEKTFERLLYDKTAAAMPDRYTNLQLAIEIGTEYLAQGEEDGAPEKHLERVRRYLDKALSMQAKAQPAPVAAPAAAAPALAAVPAAA